jgi:hypothetical protein
MEPEGMEPPPAPNAVQDRVRQRIAAALLVTFDFMGISGEGLRQDE